MLGIDGFYYFYNNCSDKTEYVLKTLASLYDDVLVCENIVPDNVSPQQNAYRTFLKQHKSALLNHYVLNVDIDEFLYLFEDQSIQELLEYYSLPDVISINWRVFGSSNRKQATLNPVTTTFNKCSEKNFPFNSQFKSLFRVRDELSGLSAHRPMYDSDEVRWIFASKDTNGVAVPTSLKTKKQNAIKVGIPPIYDRCQLNHYVVKSKEEYDSKIIRGRGTSKKSNPKGDRHTEEFFEKMDRNEQDFTLNPEFAQKLSSQIDELNKKIW